MDRNRLHDMISVRQIMKSLRALTARDMPPQERLDKIVEQVAQRLNVDVCSCYISRPGGILELCATYGLDKKAVHETFLRIGEGLVGEIALQRKPLAVEDVWSHTSFVYKPETKEKQFKSLVGVPLIRANRILGVLAIQTRKIQTFSSEMIELLETIGMVLAEMLASQQFKKSDSDTLSVGGRQKIEGTGLIDGFAIGQALVHKRAEQVVQVLSGDAQKEIQKLMQALERVECEVNKILATSHMSGDQSAIFETYLMFIKDKGWIAKMIKAIETGLTADAAVQKVGDEITDRMELMTDPYIKERIHDFRDLVGRLRRHLGRAKSIQNRKIPRNTILIAKNLGPAELLDYDKSKIKGIVLEEGSQTMHMVIVARSLNIPLVCGIKNVAQIISNGDSVALDATAGNVYLNPSDETLDVLSERAQNQKKLRARYAQMKDLPATTRDGTTVSLNINAGLSNDLMVGDGVFFDGVGLYRTELPFMIAEELPDVKTQEDIYRRALMQAQNKPVVFRSLDIGSDKVLPYFQRHTEENPAMGWRSIRMTLDRRALLRSQLRAFIRAAAGLDLYVMFPMIASVREFIEARKTLMMEVEREKRRGGTLPRIIRVGTMIEVPSLIFQMEQLVREVDFISIGTNDLAQFLYACDRGNPMIWNRYDSLSPSLLKALKYICDICQQAHVPCSVCGEMASRSLEAVALVGLGFRSLSMTPSSLGPVKAAIRTMDQKHLSAYLEKQLEITSGSLREKLKMYARDHGILI